MRKVAGLIAAFLLALPCAAQERRRSQEEKRPAASPLTAPGGVVVEVGGGAAEAAATPAAPCPGAPALRVAVVIKARANLRDRANIAGAAVASVRAGSALVIEAEDGPGSPWFKVTDVQTGKKGWVHGDVIRVTYTR
jgi:hypothetical protein